MYCCRICFEYTERVLIVVNFLCVAMYVSWVMHHLGNHRDFEQLKLKIQGLRVNSPYLFSRLDTDVQACTVIQFAVLQNDRRKNSFVSF